VLEAARFVAVLLTPLVPELSARMLSQLGQQPLPSGLDAIPPTGEAPSLWERSRLWGGLTGGMPLPEPVPVMQRLELDTPL
jgi:methionyl-tRNA synthetase